MYWLMLDFIWIDTEDYRADTELYTGWYYNLCRLIQNCKFTLKSAELYLSLRRLRMFLQRYADGDFELLSLHTVIQNGIQNEVYSGW